MKQFSDSKEIYFDDNVYTKKTILERVLNFDYNIETGLDLYVLFSNHNILTDNGEVTILKKHLELYNLRSNNFPYFEENFIYIYVLNKSTASICIEFHDYNEPIDIKERKQVKRYLEAMLPQMFNDNVKFYYELA